MKDKFKWNLNKVQNPTGLHIAITMGTCNDWRKFVDDIKQSIKLMKENPTLNHNESVATYGMCAKIPDTRFLGNLGKHHSAALLDAIWWEKYKFLCQFQVVLKFH